MNMQRGTVWGMTQPEFGGHPRNRGGFVCRVPLNPLIHHQFPLVNGIFLGGIYAIFRQTQILFSAQEPGRVLIRKGLSCWPSKFSLFSDLLLRKILIDPKSKFTIPFWSVLAAISNIYFSIWNDYPTFCSHHTIFRVKNHIFSIHHPSFWYFTIQTFHMFTMHHHAFFGMNYLHHHPNEHRPPKPRNSWQGLCPLEDGIP